MQSHFHFFFSSENSVFDFKAVGPVLDPNCLQRLSANDKSRREQGKIESTTDCVKWLGQDHSALYLSKSLIQVNRATFPAIDALLSDYVCSKPILQIVLTEIRLLP